MRLSIIVPSYNQAIFIGRTIDSILSQNDPDLELIVVDGASTDGTQSVVKSYGDRIHVFISEKDHGQSDALQKGLNLASGDYIGWQNSDDVYLPGAFAVFRKNLAADLQHKRVADVYFGDLQVVDNNDRILYRKIYGPFRPDYLRYVGWNITNQTSFFSRRRLLAVSGFDISLHYAMDFDLYMRLVESGASFKWINQYLGNFRIHEQSKGSTLLETRRKEYTILRKKYILGYSECEAWTKQFGGKRFYERFLRLLNLIRSGNSLSAIFGRWFPVRRVLW